MTWPKAAVSLTDTASTSGVFSAPVGFSMFWLISVTILASADPRRILKGNGERERERWCWNGFDFTFKPKTTAAAFRSVKGERRLTLPLPYQLQISVACYMTLDWV